MRAPFSTSNSRPGLWLLLRRCLWLGGFVLLGVALVSAGLPRVPNDYFCGYRAKHERLRSLGAGKLVLCGGSNVALGIETRSLEAALDRPGVNLALGVGLGLAFMVNEVAPDIREGDVIVFFPEYQLFFGPDWRGSPSLGLLLFDLPEAWQSVSLANVPALPAVWLQALKIRLSTVFNTGCLRNLREVEPVYDLDAFDDRGDVVAHLDLPTTCADQGHRFISGDARPNPVCFRLLRDLDSLCRSRRATLLVVPPCLLDAVYQRHQVSIDAFWQELRRQVGSAVQGSPADYTFPRECIFDNAYHLNRQGRERRMALLANQLRAAIAEQRPAGKPIRQ